jgi:hypothetical protein
MGSRVIIADRNLDPDNELKSFAAISNVSTYFQDIVSKLACVPKVPQEYNLVAEFLTICDEESAFFANSHEFDRYLVVYGKPGTRPSLL